ncbi:MAG: CDP-2,3-bis-(O-geranylgeranyl)-sn-glycerol synthase [Candidatus Micrarchaeota archaeon]|nr:CDP-2,3-bis-(O-geranylgeranyl)-sn-glycerol synthase [Candidatus Micrarchaeota archaeon]MDE1847825.1 CDP-2,3-bis-(O-geranylgeranyl)-sn-glycerol synthase [Candidatus Micrarchaeota archaeon]MDE1864369.1 CDP-2,3-bis-(O-geranylgeranyl)-sn-glycerol synthase [Candidatus Micrarchaeota archaeon]
MDYLYSIVVYPILYILPAYVANGAPVLFGGGRAIDAGRKLWGNPIFGKNKTVRGLLTGILAGSLVGLAESPVFPYMILVGIVLSLGTHIGDLLGSFIKRRLGQGPGQSSQIMDQYLFVIFALLLAYPLAHTPSLYGVVFILVITGALHLFTNIAAHRMRLKAVPW